MRKILFTSLSLLLLNTTLKAQATNFDIPNSGFESWTTTGNYEDPTGWATTNPYTGVLNAKLTTKSTNSFSGSFAAQIETKMVPGLGLLPGIVGSGRITKMPTTGNFSDFQVSGFPFNGAPEGFTGQIKYTPAGTDTAFIMVAITKFNTETQKRDTVGLGKYAQTTANNGYISINVPITYGSSRIADSATIVITSSSLMAPVAGSVLLADDLKFAYLTAGSEENEGLAKFKLFPNPATYEVMMDNIPTEASNFEICDLTGKTMLVKNINSANQSFNLSDLSKGMYIYNLKDSEGNIIKSGKFNIYK